MIAGVRLIGYIARPVRPLGLAAAAIGCWALASWGIRWATTQEPIADGFVALSMLGLAVVLGASTGFVVSRDVDRAEALLLSMPRSFAWALCARLAGWLAVSLSVVSAIAMTSAPTLSVPDSRAIASSLVPYFLAVGVAAVAGRLSSALIGAAVGLGAAAFYLGISMFVPEWSVALPMDPSRSDFGNDLASALLTASGVLVTSVAVVFVTLRRTARDDGVGTRSV